MATVSVNDHLICSLFERMAEQKPSLKYLSMAAEESGEPLDPRRQAAEIISHFPWPLGVELRRLFSASMLALDRARLDQLFKTIERTMQFITFALISQAADEASRRRLQVSDGFRREYGRRFSQLTMGNLAWLIQALGELFQANGIEAFLPEMGSLFQPAFYKSLNFWAPERNEIGHYLINLTQEETEVRCVEYAERLSETLGQLTFLIRYPLLTIMDVSVRKFHQQAASFHHRILLLNSMSSDFPGDLKEYENFTDTHSVLLVSSLKNAPRSFLNLSPLIIDTHAEVLDSREKIRNIRKDIFLYSKWSANQLHYLGTEVTEKCDLRSLSFYDQLLAQFDRILRLSEGGDGHA